MDKIVKEEFQVFWQPIYKNKVPLKLHGETLESDRLVLEPIGNEHRYDFYKLIDSEIWRWYTISIQTKEDMDHYIDEYLLDFKKGKALGYAVRDKESGKIIGASRFLNIDKLNCRVEIGSTWYHPKWQRTFVNTECKLLMLSYAFEKLGCIGVHFQTDTMNNASRRAIERIGGKLEGVLRNHRVCQDGRIRHSALYSITDEEWPQIKKMLVTKLKQY